MVTRWSGKDSIHGARVQVENSVTRLWNPLCDVTIFLSRMSLNHSIKSNGIYMVNPLSENSSIRN